MAPPFDALFSKNVVVANARGFQQLPEARRKALADAAAAAEKRGWAMSQQREKESNETLAKNGVTLHQPDAAMMAEFTRIGGVIVGEWLKTAGPDGEAIIKAYRAR